MQFSSYRMFSQDNLVFNDVIQEILRIQGEKPYLPDKSDNNFKSDNPVTERYKGKIMPWDIEARHIIENRERLRNAPIGIRWTKEEMDKFNSLTDIKEKRAMILEKSQLKSVYLPHLKWEKYMINFPNMPHTAKSKDSFEKGYKLYNEKKYDEAYPLLYDAYTSGNYVAAQLLATILKYRLNEGEFRRMYGYVTDGGFIQNFPLPDVVKAHNEMIIQLEKIANFFISKDLPYGYFLLADIDYHYMLNFKQNAFHRAYRKSYVKNIVQAAYKGSYDACMKLAHTNHDLEWALAAMIISHDYKGFDEFVKRFGHDFFEYASPRNLAIVRLAAMWGSNYAMDCLTFGESGNFLSTFNHRILDAYPDGGIYMPDDEIDYRKSIYAKYYGKDTGKFEGTLIPDLDTVYPPKPVIYSPYNITPYLHYAIEEGYAQGIIHPLAKNATEESIIKFREFLSEYEQSTWLDQETLKETKEYKEILKNDARSDMAMVEFEDIDRLFGYLNVMKMRELEQNPLYYPSGRIYIYPKSFYEKHPDWY